MEKPPASAKTSSPPRVGSASIAVWARYGLGARKQASANASAFIRPPILVLYKWFIGQAWVDRRLPSAWRPYTRLARLDRPVGVWLTLFPCLAALIQASHGFPAFRQLIVFPLGALLMRSAGSTVNDIADRKFDAHVERTRFRPLANGQLGPRQAIVFLIVELALAASLLFF